MGEELKYYSIGSIEIPPWLDELINNGRVKCNYVGDEIESIKVDGKDCYNVKPGDLVVFYNNIITVVIWMALKTNIKGTSNPTKSFNFKFSVEWNEVRSELKKYFKFSNKNKINTIRSSTGALYY